VNELQREFAINLLITWAIMYILIVGLSFPIYFILNDDPATALNYNMLIINVFLAAGIAATVSLYSSRENKILKQLVEKQGGLLQKQKRP